MYCAALTGTTGDAGADVDTDGDGPAGSGASHPLLLAGDVEAGATVSRETVTLLLGVLAPVGATGVSEVGLVAVDRVAMGWSWSPEGWTGAAAAGAVGLTGTTVWVSTAVAVGVGMVNVTVTIVSAHTEQAVTVVKKPRGQPLGWVGQTNGAVVVAGATGTVVVRVNGRVVKPVGQMSMYEVVQTVVV